jgi:signal transduction histidine kinase
MKKFFICIWITLGSLILSAQSPEQAVDRLLQDIETLESQRDPNVLVNAYETLGRYYFGQRQWDQSLEWLLKGLDLTEAYSFGPQRFLMLHLTGSIFFYPKDEYEQSLSYLLQAQGLADSLGLVSPYVQRNLSRLGEVYNSIGNVNQSLVYQTQAVSRAEQDKDTLGMAMGYRNIGVIYWGKQQYDNALRKFYEAENLLLSCLGKEMADPILQRDKALSYYNVVASISGVQISLDSVSVALIYAERALAIADSIGHAYGVAYSEALNGRLLMNEKRYPEALQSLDRAVSIYRKMDLKREWASFSVNLAEVLLKLDKPNRAIQVLDQAEPVALQINDPAIKRDIYDMQAQVLENLGQIEQAYERYKSYVRLKDSLQSTSQLTALAQYEPQQQVQAQEAQIETLMRDQEFTRRQLILVVFGLSLVFLSVMLYLGYLRNKTLRSVNRMLAQKNEEIKRQNERLASSNEDLRQFAHVVSHDLREPLRSIGSFATLLQRRYLGNLDQDADEFINFITGGVKRMDNLLADLMAYSVVGIFQQDMRLVDVNEVIQDIIETTTREKGTLGARINISNLPAIVANRNQIRQLFQQLIDNAIKFRSEALPEVRIEASRQGSYYLFAVQDNGIGMDELYKDKIFSLFLRLHTKKSKYKGTGIGLSICKKIVEQHKGKIWIDSELGIGTTVYFTLPESPAEVEVFEPHLIEA